MTPFVPVKPIEFQVGSADDGTLVVEARGVYDRDELALAFANLAGALRDLQFTVRPTRDGGENGPQLPIEFPVQRQWRWVSESEAVLEESDGGQAGEHFELRPERSRTWRFRWNRNGTVIEMLGDAANRQRDDLWSRLSSPQIKFDEGRVEPQDDGRLLLTGCLKVINAPPLGRAYRASVLYTGAAGTVEAQVDQQGRLEAHLQPLPNRPASMRFSIALPSRINQRPVQAETNDIVVRTHFAGAEVTVDDAAPQAYFGLTIPAGRLPLAIRFASATYRPSQTALRLVTSSNDRSYDFRMEESGPDSYRLFESNPGLDQLIEAQLDVRLESQEQSAGSLTVIPETLVGRWVAAEEEFQWQPERALPALGIDYPDAKNSERPQRVAFRGTRLAVDPTAFQALLPKAPLQAISTEVLALISTAGRLRTTEYVWASQKNPVIRTLRPSSSGKGKFEVADIRREFKSAGVTIQSKDGTEQGLLWMPQPLADAVSSYVPVRLDEIENAEGREALVVFRGIYWPAAVRRLKASDGGGDHWMIELVTPIAFPRDVQMEPFFPLLMHVPPSDAPSRVLLWQFGQREVSLTVRSDGLVAGANVGYVFRPRSASGDALEFVPFPPSPDDAEAIVYHSWGGFLIAFTPKASDLRFAGWFLSRGQATYPKRVPFDAYRLASTRKSTGGLLVGTATSGWSWPECTIPEAEVAAIVEIVQGCYKIPKSEADLANLDATEREVAIGPRRFLLQPAWSTRQKQLQVRVTEQPQEPAARTCEAFYLFAEKKKV